MDNLIITPLLLGLLVTTSPCVLPLYPGYLAYLSGQNELGGGKYRYFLGFFVLAGVLSMMLALGALIALLSVSIGGVLRQQRIVNPVNPVGILRQRNG